MFTNRLFSGLVICSALIATPLLWAGIVSVTIFNDLAGTTTPGGYVVGQYSPGSTYVEANAFTSIGPRSKLSQIQALLSFGTGINDITLSIYQDSDGVPGSLLESWHLVNVLGSAPAIVTLDSVKKPALSFGQQYWITARMTDPASTAYWWGNNLGIHGIASHSHNGGPFVPGTVSQNNSEAFAVTVTTVTGDD